MANCYSVNFGWPQELSIPELVINLEDDISFDVSSVTDTAPSNCFLVLVGGRYVQRLDDIVSKMEVLSVQTASKQIIYIAEKSDVEPEFNQKHTFVVDY